MSDRINSPAGAGDIDADSLFVDFANDDFHLKSERGHWNGVTFVKDAATSPCVDAGDPGDPFANEVAPHGSRINMGAYGNTVEASLSPTAPVPIISEQGIHASIIGGVMVR